MSARTHDEILKTFRQQLFEEGILNEGDTIGTDDETLLRYLRARKFNLAQSKTMITNAQEWRKTFHGVGIDKLYSEIDPFDYPGREAVFDCWPLYFHKTDKKGRPLNIHTLAGVDFPKLYQQMTPEDHWNSLIVNAECLPREILPIVCAVNCLFGEAGRPIGTVLVIVDLKGFSLGKFWQMKTLARNSFQISQDYFPETMGQLAIVNAPSSFAFIWSIIKGWLSKETAEKVDILGSDYKKVLLDLIDADALPSTLGGNCECEEGCHLSSAGPWLDGRVGWGPKSKAKSGVNGGKKDATGTSVISDGTTDGGQHLEIPNVQNNAKLDGEKQSPTLGHSDAAKPNGNDTQEEDPWRAEKGLQQNAVESPAEVVAVSTVTS